MMMNKALVAMGSVGFLIVGGCCLFRAKPTFPANLCLRASPRLQWYEERAHTLYVRVFPLKNTESFVAADTSDLLADPPPALPGSVGNPQSRMIYPDTVERLNLNPPLEDKKETVTHLGIVAGYYQPKGRAKQVLEAAVLRGDSCYTVLFGPSGIESPETQAESGGKK
jgi:predicted component of type VI protein secretion system